MLETLKEIVISIGIFLGVVSPQNDPQLHIKIYKTDTEVLFSLEIAHCINPDIRELIHAANPVEVRLTVHTGSQPQPQLQIRHRITYDPATGIYTVYYSNTDQFHRTDNTTAAFSIFAGFYRIPILETADFQRLSRKTLSFTAAIDLEQQGGFDPGVLWNYKEPRQSFTYQSLKEIPY